MSEPWQQSATALAAAIAAGELTASEALESCLARVEAVNGSVNAVTAVYAEQARAAAATADERQRRREALGPLHGVPFTVKENIDCAGWPTTLGVPAMAGAIAPADAPIVAQLRAAGAIPFAATNLPDFALRWDTDSSLHGRTVNPWDAGRTAGGSSGGAAAALATGLGPLALGNDIGGSLRYPAQCCGIASLKPGLGRIARANATLPEELPFGFQLMYVEGPMARSVADLRVALAAASGFDRRDPWWVPAPAAPGAPAEPRRIAVCADPLGMGVETQVADGVRRAADALADAGYALEEAEAPRIAEAMEIWASLLFTEVRAALLETVRLVCSADAVRSLDLIAPCAPDLDKAGLMRALAGRTTLLREWLAFFERYPLILGPVSTARPFAVGDDVHSEARSRAILESQRLIVAVNLLNLPVAVAPAGIAGGLPQAVQIIGPPFAEGWCLDAAAALETALGPMTPIDPR